MSHEMYWRRAAESSRLRRRAAILEARANARDLRAQLAVPKRTSLASFKPDGGMLMTHEAWQDRFWCAVVMLRIARESARFHRRQWNEALEYAEEHEARAERDAQYEAAKASL